MPRKPSLVSKIGPFVDNLKLSGIRPKIIALAVVCVLITATGLTGVAIWRTKGIVQEAEAEVTQLTDENIDNTLKGIYSTIKMKGEALDAQLQGTVKTIDAIVSRSGGLAIDEGQTSTWEVDFGDGKPQSVQVPMMTLGGKPLPVVREMSETAPIVDEVRDITGQSMTLFQKIKDDNTMMRRVSNAATPGSDKRQIGTVMSGTLPNGAPNPVVAKVMSGESFQGVIEIKALKTTAVVHFAPLKSGDEVIGMLGMGSALSALTDIDELLNSAQIGDNGMVEILSTQGAGKGTVRMSSIAERVGQNLLGYQDANGNLFAEKALEAVLSVPEGQFVTLPYTDAESGDRVVRLAYYKNWDWLILVNTSVEDFQGPVHHMDSSRHSMVLILIGTAVLLTIIGAAIAWGMGASVTRPLLVLRDRMREIAEGDGDLTARVAESDRDEVGQLGLAFNRFVSRVAETVRAAMDSARSVDEAAAAINVSTVKLSEGAKVSAEQSAAAFDSAGQVNESVSTVASATQEMISSIQEISQSADEAARVGQQAGDLAAQTQGAVAALGTSSQEIGNVISVISSVAAQTNLLALNATIEAARAGDAGKGFAVVADEVKQLAQETAEATEEIARRVKAIQEDSGNAVGAIDQITEVVQLIMQHQTTIAAAVEEQSATTSEVSRGVDNAAGGVGQITDMTGRVGQEAQASAVGMNEIREAAESLAAVSGDLSRQLGAFKV